jgi:hypothetical protein
MVVQVSQSPLESTEPVTSFACKTDYRRIHAGPFQEFTAGFGADRPRSSDSFGSRTFEPRNHDATFRFGRGPRRPPRGLLLEGSAIPLALAGDSA